MVELKPSYPHESNESNIQTDKNKVQASNPKKYRGKKLQNKPIPELETETDFQGLCTDLEGYTFDLGLRASEKFSRKMKELDPYLGATYSDIYQAAIITETAATIPDPWIPTITDLGTERPKTDGDMASLKKRISISPSAKTI